MNKKKIALLVTSFDGFNDLWHSLDKNYQKYVDNKIDCYLMTNFLKPDLKKLKYLDIGIDLEWSQNLKNALKRLDGYEFIFLTLDDVFFKSKLSYKEIENYCDLLNQTQANYLSLLNRPSSKFIKKNKLFAYISKDSLYPVSAGLCVWRTKQLIKVLYKNQSAWQYERNFEIDDENKYISLNKNFKKIIHAVVKGKLYPSAIAELQKQDILLQTNRNKYSNIIESLHSIRNFFRLIVINIFNLMNLSGLLRCLRGILIK